MHILVCTDMVIGTMVSSIDYPCTQLTITLSLAIILSPCFSIGCW